MESAVTVDKCSYKLTDVKCNYRLELQLQMESTVKDGKYSYRSGVQL